MSGLCISRLCLALVWCDLSLSLGAATPDTELVAASLVTASLIDLAERVERLLDERCLRADVGMIEAPELAA